MIEVRDVPRGTIYRIAFVKQRIRGSKAIFSKFQTEEELLKHINNPCNQIQEVAEFFFFYDLKEARTEFSYLAKLQTVQYSRYMERFLIYLEQTDETGGVIRPIKTYDSLKKSKVFEV